MRADLALQDRDYEEVEGLGLQDVLDDAMFAHCDFLKLDCEGAEFEILHDTPPAVWQRVEKMVVEYHTFPGQDKHRQAGELVMKMQELGFSIDHYTDVAGTNWGTIYARRKHTDV